MKPLALTPALLRAAMRCMWYKSPADAVADPVHFTAHVLTYGLHEDVMALREQMDDPAMVEALRHAPPGIFDPRSWAYWHLKLGLYPPPPMPERRFVK